MTKLPIFESDESPPEETIGVPCPQCGAGIPLTEGTNFPDQFQVTCLRCQTISEHKRTDIVPMQLRRMQ